MDNDRSTFKRRLGIYLMGVSIGLMLLGIFHMQRRAAQAQRDQAQAQRAQEQAAQAQAAQGQPGGQPAAPTPAPTPAASTPDEGLSPEVRAQQEAEAKIKAEQRNPPNAGDSAGGP
jgi:cell division protein FtsN